MRYFRCYVFVISLLFLFMASGVEVSAMTSGFSTEDLSEKDSRTFISNIDFAMLKEKPAERAIQCFDVSENGRIALGQDGTDGEVLCVYSSDGEFQYGYTFNCGQSFGVEWTGENINIFFVRSDVLMTVNREGEILDIAQVQNTIENNTYYNHYISATERRAGNTRYTIRNDMGILNVFATSYSQLIMTKSTGEEIILYDVNSVQFAKSLTICVLAIILFLSAVAVIVWQFIKLNSNR